MKVATLVALSEKPDRVITVNNLEVALALLEATETHLLKVFQGIGRNELSAISHKVLTFMEASPERGIIYEGKKCMAKLTPDKILYATFNKEANMKELNDIFEHLIRADKIFKFPTGGRILVGLKESIRDVPQGDETGGEKI